MTLLSKATYNCYICQRSHASGATFLRDTLASHSGFKTGTLTPNSCVLSTVCAITTSKDSWIVLLSLLHTLGNLGSSGQHTLCTTAYDSHLSDYTLCTKGGPSTLAHLTWFIIYCTPGSTDRMQ